MKIYISLLFLLSSFCFAMNEPDVIMRDEEKVYCPGFELTLNPPVEVKLGQKLDFINFQLHTNVYREPHIMNIKDGVSLTVNGKAVTEEETPYEITKPSVICVDGNEYHIAPPPPLTPQGTHELMMYDLCENFIKNIRNNKTGTWVTGYAGLYDVSEEELNNIKEKLKIYEYMIRLKSAKRFQNIQVLDVYLGKYDQIKTSIKKRKKIEKMLFAKLHNYPDSLIIKEGIDPQKLYFGKVVLNQQGEYIFLNDPNIYSAHGQGLYLSKDPLTALLPGALEAQLVHEGLTRNKPQYVEVKIWMVNALIGDNALGKSKERSPRYVKNTTIITNSSYGNYGPSRVFVVHAQDQLLPVYELTLEVDTNRFYMFAKEEGILTRVKTNVFDSQYLPKQ